MNKELVWEFEDAVKEAFKQKIQRGAELSDLRVTGRTNTEETRMVVKILLEGGYVDLTLEPGVYVISRPYYNYLKRQL